MKMIIRTLLPALLVVTVVGFQPASALHKPGCANSGNLGGNSANYTGSNSDVVADSSQGAPGEKVKLHGCGYRANSNVDFHLNSAPIFLGKTTTNASGAFDAEVTIPANAPVGRHTITATGLAPNGSAKVESVPFTVVAAQAAGRPAAAGTLPRTGTSSTVPLVAGSTALLGLGTVLVIAARRRRLASQ